MYCRSVYFAFVLFVLIDRPVALAGTPGIERLTPFATADSLRVECEISGQENLTGVQVEGKIVHARTGESRKFAEDYVRFLKEKNVNIIRLTHDSQVWFDVCDELGMMVYQGQYGSPLGVVPGKQHPPENFKDSVEQYQRLFETY